MSTDEPKSATERRNAAIRKRRAAMLKLMRRDVATFRKIVRGKVLRKSS